MITKLPFLKKEKKDVRYRRAPQKTVVSN